MPDGLIFRDDQGHLLTEADLYEAMMLEAQGLWGADPEPAEGFIERAQAAEISGDSGTALDLLEQAHVAAPLSPQPLLRAAHIHLSLNDVEAAERCFAQVDQIFPRGYLDAKPALDSLRKERAGELKPGTYWRFVRVWELDDLGEQREELEAIVKECPRFAPAWDRLAVLRVMGNDENAAMAAIESGLGCDPDPETAGGLEMWKALILGVRGKRDEATRILVRLALDPRSTLYTECYAKCHLAKLWDLEPQRARL